MGYTTACAVVVSTAWVAYYASVRRWGGYNKNAPGAQDLDHERSTNTESGSRADPFVPVPEITASQTEDRPVATDAPILALNDENDSEDGEKTPTQTSPPRISETPLPPAPSSIPPPSTLSAPMAPPPVPRLRPPTFSPMPSNRMAPPPRPYGSSLRPPASSASSLRVPPMPKGQSLSTSTLPANGKPSSRQVTLSPGHSPLDWATLTHNPSATLKLRGADASRISTILFSTPHALLRIPPSTLRRFNGRKGRCAWTSYQGKIYNISAYLPFHPGGEPELLKGAGRGSDKLFAEVHPWVNWEGMLKECCVGILVGEEDERSVKVDREGNLVGIGQHRVENPLDEMD